MLHALRRWYRVTFVRAYGEPLGCGYCGKVVATGLFASDPDACRGTWRFGRGWKCGRA